MTARSFMHGPAFVFMIICMIYFLMNCKGMVPMKVPENVIILGETTVAVVDGYRVGSGNYYQRADAGGVKRKSIQVSVWQPGPKEPHAVSFEVFEGDTFDIGYRKFKLVRVDEGKGDETGKAYIVPVK
jgi:hypothetical protein